jgi:hypothetical protein
MGATMKTDSWSAKFTIVYVFLLGSLVSVGQTGTTGILVGTVRDGSGAVISRASVDLVGRATSLSVRAQTNELGTYVFPNVPPGDYDVTVTAKGFKTGVLSAVRVEVAKSALADVVLTVGQATEIVTVNASGTQLQTEDSSVGDVVGGETLEQLPTIERRASELAYLSVTAQPILGTGGYDKGGGVAGAQPDQNSFMLDGIDITDVQEAGIYGQIGPGMPLPLEAVEEFRGTVTNANASFGKVSGGQFALATRHGTNDFHGSAYFYYQNSELDANTWTQNFLGQPRTLLHDNRFGVRVGGPIVRDRTFFFGFYEGRRFPQSTDTVHIVPTDTFRQGILEFPDATGNIISYPLATSTLCGNNNSACDPRGIGMSPVISQLMSHYPHGNAPSDGDGLNFIGFRGPADSSQREDFALSRLDHNLSQTVHLNGSFLYSRERVLTPGNQVEMDPALTGGKPFKTLAGLPNDGRVADVSISDQVTPHLLNNFRVGWTQSGIPFQRQLAYTQVAAAGAPLQLAPNLLNSPGDPGGFQARPEFSRAHVWHLVDDLSWLKGRHNLQAGFTFMHEHFYHSAFDNIGVSEIPVGVVQAGPGTNVTIPATQAPPACSQPSQTNCLPSSDFFNWDNLYAAALGIVDNDTYFTPRDAQGNALPASTPSISDDSWRHLELYAADTFRLTPSITLSYGLNFMHESPVNDAHSRQGFLINASTGQLIDPKVYIAQKGEAAEQGQVYNPTVGFAPRSLFNNRGIYPNQNKFAPRVAISWSPSLGSGLLGRLLGERKTVLRAGYGLFFDRINVVGPINFAVSGDQHLATTESVQAPLNIAGQPYRVGVDGPVPIPEPAASLPIPFVPAPRNVELGTSFPITFGTAFSPNYSVGHTHSANITLQRQVRSNLLVEVGWIGRYGRNLPTAYNLGGIPVFIKDMSGKSNQTFAQAFDGVANQLRGGVQPAAVTPQPWFENNLGVGGTANVATADPGDFVSVGTLGLFQNVIDPMLIASGTSPVNSQQFQQMQVASNGGWLNYNALFASLHTRSLHGLTFTANYTYGHSLTTGGGVQDELGNPATDPFDLHFDYADALTDRRHSFVGYGAWAVPFARNNRFLRGWYFSGIFSAYTGLPLGVNEGGTVFGQSFGIESVPSATGVPPSVGLHHNVTGSDGVATAGNPANGGTGLNLFADPAAVFNTLRPFELSTDHRSARGLIRDLGWWNLDSSMGRKFNIGERLKMTFSLDAFNLFNHVIFSDPGSMSLNDPANFGVITNQAGNPSAMDFAGPRRLQAGLRFDF